MQHNIVVLYFLYFCKYFLFDFNKKNLKLNNKEQTKMQLIEKETLVINPYTGSYMEKKKV